MDGYEEKPHVRKSNEFRARLHKLVEEIELGMNCEVIVARDHEVPMGRFYFQIKCLRRDVITGEMGYGYGGKAYLSPHATDNELIQTVFGLYKGYWEHEARENFKWRGRRVFGPHISTEALWEIARRVDHRGQKHVEDRTSADIERNVQNMMLHGTPNEVSEDQA